MISFYHGITAIADGDIEKQCSYRIYEGIEKICNISMEEQLGPSYLNDMIIAHTSSAILSHYELVFVCHLDWYMMGG